MTDNIYFPMRRLEYPFPCEIYQVTDDYAALTINMLEITVQANAQVILETGTNVGDSARIWLAGLEKTGGELWTVDIQDWGDAWGTDIPNLHFLKGSSIDISWDKEIDILYLDSDHTYGHVMKELYKFGPYVKKGGFIVLNDTLHHGYGWEITSAIRHWMLTAGLAIWAENVRGYGLAMIRVEKKVERRQFPQ